MVLAAGLAGASACASARWRLLEPPVAKNANYPGGVQVLPQAEPARWEVVDSYGSETACLAARRQRTDAAIDRAKATAGDDAKYDIAVRRAVNSRCEPPAP